MRTPPTVELVYDRDCPHVESARGMIRAALEEVGADPVWTEWDRESSATPNELRSYGSPTVLVDGCDVERDEGEPARADARACRIYFAPNGPASGVPSSQLIVDAINARLGIGVVRASRGTEI